MKRYEAPGISPKLAAIVIKKKKKNRLDTPKLVIPPATSLRCGDGEGVCHNSRALAGRLGLPRLARRRAPATCRRPRPAGSRPCSTARRQLADGRTVRLIGAKAPMPPLGCGAMIAGRSSTSRERRLAALAANQQVELGLGASRLDRHGHLLAQVFVVERRQPALAPGGAGRQGPRPRLFPFPKPRLRRRASGPRAEAREPSGSACGAPHSTASRVRST